MVGGSLAPILQEKTRFKICHQLPFTQPLMPKVQSYGAIGTQIRDCISNEDQPGEKSQMRLVRC
jgi:hypothetical protein